MVTQARGRVSRTEAPVTGSVQVIPAPVSHSFSLWALTTLRLIEAPFRPEKVTEVQWEMSRTHLLVPRGSRVTFDYDGSSTTLIVGHMR